MRYKNFGDRNGIQVWTSDGWINIRRVVRHKIEKITFTQLEQNLLM